MQNSSAILIQSVAQKRGVSFPPTTAQDTFSLYVMVLEEIEITLSDDLTGFPITSVNELKGALLIIKNDCNAFLRQNLEAHMYNKIMQIRQLLINALAQIGRAEETYKSTLADDRAHLTMYDLYQTSLLLCGNIIADINTLLIGWNHKSN